jgi:hypothetical protein
MGRVPHIFAFPPLEEPELRKAFGRVVLKEWTDWILAIFPAIISRLDSEMRSSAIGALGEAEFAQIHSVQPVCEVMLNVALSADLAEYRPMRVASFRPERPWIEAYVKAYAHFDLLNDVPYLEEFETPIPNGTFLSAQGELRIRQDPPIEPTVDIFTYFLQFSPSRWASTQVTAVKVRKYPADQGPIGRQWGIPAELTPFSLRETPGDPGWFWAVGGWYRDF